MSRSRGGAHVTPAPRLGAARGLAMAAALLALQACATAGAPGYKSGPNPTAAPTPRPPVHRQVMAAQGGDSDTDQGRSSATAGAQGSEAGGSIADLLAPAQAALTDARRQLAAHRWLRASTAREQQREHANLLLQAGQPDAALAVLDRMRTPGLTSRLTMLTILLDRHDYGRAGQLVHALELDYPHSVRVRQSLYGWWTTRGESQRVAQALRGRASGAAASPADRLAEADLDLQELKYRQAYVILDHLQGSKSKAVGPATVQAALGLAEFGLRQYGPALQSLQRALQLDPGDSSTLTAIASVLLRVGRVDDAITALRLALQISPWNEQAHDLLGNGFTRLDYTQLYAAFPAAFASGAGLAELNSGDRAWAAGRFALADKLYTELAGQHPQWADVEVRLGSLAYIEGHYTAARDYFWRAYTLCPQYGRANAGLAAALAALTYQVSIYHEQDQQALIAAPMPAIPDIEKYVINWKALPVLYQKQVALSLQPWVRYIPALELGGATLYIKPIWQMLSEAPDLSKLRDQRISYDSRLWDDVRGEGGHHVVVSDEDIVTRINHGFDTQLHEVSHQVNAILAPAWDRRIDALYAAAIRRQASLGHAFIDQYSSSSALEYFAQGAVAASDYRRNAYDTNQIVYERLKERDPALLALELELMRHADVKPSYAMSLVSRGDDYLWRGRLRLADASYLQALREDPGNVLALTNRMRTLVLLGRMRSARALAADALRRHPRSGPVVSEWAEVQWLSGAALTGLLHSLDARLGRVHPTQRYLVNDTLGDLANYSGAFARAQVAFGDALAYQPQDADALEGMGTALFAQGHRQAAWKYFEQAVQVRSGVTDIHVAYAEDLLLAGRNGRAGQQIQAALLIDPNDPDALALDAWATMKAGDVARASRTAKRAKALGSWSTLATAVLAATAARGGHQAMASHAFQAIERRAARHIPPRYVYREASGQYVLGYTASAGDMAVVNALRAAAP